MNIFIPFQALAHVPPMRNYFLREQNYAHIKRPPGDKMILLSQRFGELIRKLWNPRNFKAHVSPHEMLQAIVLCSDKKFQFTHQGNKTNQMNPFTYVKLFFTFSGDAIELLSWFLNALHVSLNGTKKTSSSIVYKTFRGKMRIYSKKIPAVDMDETEKRLLLMADEYQGNGGLQGLADGGPWTLRNFTSQDSNVC